MLFDIKKSGILKKIILRAARFPSLYLLAGIILTALSYIDRVFPLTEWKRIFDLTDKVGDILIALALIAFIYNCISLICHRYERKLLEKHKIASLIISSIRKGLRIIFILAAINIIITLIGPTKFYLILANNIINTIIISSVGWITIQILYTFEAMLYEQMMKLTREEHIRVKALYTKMHILRNIATVIIIVITIAAILMSFSSVRNIGISLLASAGFITAIIGLSAQKTLFSIFSGLQIALSQPIKIGDVVTIENESGVIEEITFTYVTLKLGDSRRLMVPITYFIDKPFENWSHKGHSLRSSLPLFLDYLMPLEPLRDELEKVLKNSSYWDGAAQKLQVAHLHERSVEIRIQISASSADDLSDLRAEVMEKLLEFIRLHYPDHFPKVRLNNGDA